MGPVRATVKTPQKRNTHSPKGTEKVKPGGGRNVGWEWLEREIGVGESSASGVVEPGKQRNRRKGQNGRGTELAEKGREILGNKRKKSKRIGSNLKLETMGDLRAQKSQNPDQQCVI